MCHIIVAISNKKLREEIANKVIGASYVAYENNSHMEGMYCNHNHAAHHSIDKSDLSAIKEEINESSMMLYHARFSTSGLGFENVQPFVDKDYVFAHNGVYNIKKEAIMQDKSDSKIVFDAFLELAKSHDVPTAYQKAVEKTCSSATSFSTFIYDVQKQVLWYTKSISPSMTVYSLEDAIIFSTREVKALGEMTDQVYKISHDEWHFVDGTNPEVQLISVGKAVYNMPPEERYVYPFKDCSSKSFTRRKKNEEFKNEIDWYGNSSWYNGHWQ